MRIFTGHEAPMEMTAPRRTSLEMGQNDAFKAILA